MLFSEFWRSKDQTYYNNGTKGTAFVYNLGFISDSVSCTETDLHNKYMTQLCVWLIFWTRPSIKLNYLGAYAKRQPKFVRISKQKLM